MMTPYEKIAIDTALILAAGMAEDLYTLIPHFRGKPLPPMVFFMTKSGKLLMGESRNFVEQLCNRTGKNCSAL